MILCGYGTGKEAGDTLCRHLHTNGMDAVLVPPCGEGRAHLSRRYWIHSVRMRYLTLKKEYRRIAIIGMSIGGLLQLHLAQLKPAAAVFINSPTAESSLPEMRRLFRRDLKPELGGLKTPLGYYQFWKFMKESQDTSVAELECPTLILQTRDDAVSDPAHAEGLFERLRTGEKYIRYYECGGHNVLDSSREMAVCSDVFQFCSSIRGEW